MKRLRGWLVLATMALPGVGCRTYRITQFEHRPVAGFSPSGYRRAAIITHHRQADDVGDRRPGVVDPNKLFLEAFQVELMKRGVEVVEREKFQKLVDEQLLVLGEMTNLSDREKAMRVGQMLNVDVVFYGDALINNSRYEYEPIFLVSTEAKALQYQTQANEQGVVEGVGKFKIHGYHNVGVTVRAIDAKSGEIVWVGYRMLAVCEEVTEDSPTALTSFATVKDLCGMVLDDFFKPADVGARKG